MSYEAYSRDRLVSACVNTDAGLLSTRHNGGEAWDIVRHKQELSKHSGACSGILIIR